MLRKFVQGRVCVFIDAANILYSQKTLGWRIDYRRFKNYLLQECDLQKLFFYTGKVGDNIKQQRFLAKLWSIGYIVRTKEVKRIKIAPNEYILKGNLDGELIIDALTQKESYDTCILISGDSDFASLLDELKRNGKRVLVVSTKGHIAKELIERAKYVNLKKLRQYISLNGI